MTLDQILEEIKKAETIVILTHETPDGDAVGSALAMKIAIENMGKKPDVIIPIYARIYDILKGTKDIKKESDIKSYDLAIAVDCADVKRIAEGNTYYDNAKVKVNIDHHGTNNMFGDINFVNPVAPSCCEILVGMFEYWGLDISIELGECLITGIITDTGGFKYSGVNSETFEFAAELLRKGVNISEIYKRVMDTKTRAYFELQKLICERMEFIENGKISFTYMNCEDEKRVGAEEGDHEGLVNVGRDVEGVEVSVFIREKEDTDGYKVSLRSNTYVNVSDIAFKFGGGGHPRAAGCFISGNVQEVKEKVISEIVKVLE